MAMPGEDPNDLDEELCFKDRVTDGLVCQQNLYDFLTVACKKKWLSNWFWTDALCIDQANTVEKSHQVAHMGHIYAHALRAVVWLGKTVSPHSRAVKATDLDSWRSSVLENEYWDRAWVTQEIVRSIWLSRSPKIFLRSTTILYEDGHKGTVWSRSAYRHPDYDRDMYEDALVARLRFCGRRSSQPLVAGLFIGASAGTTHTAPASVRPPLNQSVRFRLKRLKRIDRRALKSILRILGGLAARCYTQASLLSYNCVLGYLSRSESIELMITTIIHAGPA